LALDALKNAVNDVPEEQCGNKIKSNKNNNN